MANDVFDWVGSVPPPDDTLYSGTAGLLLGYAEAAAAGLPPDGIPAGRNRDRLLHIAAREEEAVPAESTFDDSMFDGWAGVAVALRAWHGVTGDQSAGEAAATVTARVAARVLSRGDDPARYTDVISGDAGILLALAGEHAEAVNHLADGLITLAEDRPDGLHWRMKAGFDRLMPGFSHGTAGVAYALGTASMTLGRTDLRDVAVRAADGLLALGNRPEGWQLPLLIPPKPGRPEFYGWCHGPAGTMRLFTLLDEIDPQPRWQQAIDACLQALRDSGMRTAVYPDHWDNVARCCGTAGVVQQLLNRYLATGDKVLLDWARELAADYAAAPPTEHSFMRGGAGIGGLLARLEAPETPPLIDWL